jgi:hypothetical protein
MFQLSLGTHVGHVIVSVYLFEYAGSLDEPLMNDSNCLNAKG